MYSWLKAPKDFPFIKQSINVATVFFSMSSEKYSEQPNLRVTVLAAAQFDSAQIIIPDTLDLETIKYLPIHGNKTDAMLLEELHEKGVKWYNRNAVYFQPLINKVGKAAWEKEGVKFWKHYQSQPRFAAAKQALLDIMKFEQESGDTQKSYSFTDSVYRTVQKRINVVYGTKNTLYSLELPIAKDIQNYILNELAQLLVLALDLKEQYKEKINEVSHAILYAHPLSQPMYKLFQYLTALDEHKFQSKVNEILKPYKVPPKLMQPLSINWESKEVKQLLSGFENSHLLEQNVTTVAPTPVKLAYQPTLYLPQYGHGYPNGKIRRSSPPTEQLEDLVTTAISIAKKTQMVKPEEMETVVHATFTMYKLLLQEQASEPPLSHSVKDVTAEHAALYSNESMSPPRAK